MEIASKARSDAAAVVTRGLEWENVKLSVNQGRGKSKTTKHILHGVSGYAHMGEITAVMGPSGSGKTSLVNTLTGRMGGGKYNLEGRILFQGKPRNEDVWKSTTAYVEQDDLMFDCLTVEETIIFSAIIRLSNKVYTKAQKIERARNVIELLGLSKCKDSKVGSTARRGISGGERKRCAVGVELVTSPKLMFLDEPTSGLDSYSAYNVISSVKDIARQGVAVMVTIHQPSYELFQLFDKVLLIAEGRTAFHGTIQEAEKHFAHIGYPVPTGANAADHFISMLTAPPSDEEKQEKVVGRVTEILDAWDCRTGKQPSNNNSEQTLQTNPAPPVHAPVLEVASDADDVVAGYALNPVEELYWLTRRGFTQAMRDKEKIYADFGSNIFIGLILAFSFFRLGNGQSDVIGKAGLLFFVPINVSFSVLFPIVTYLPLLNGILVRERSTGAYRVASFYLSRYLVEIPQVLLSRTIFFVLVYWICGLKAEAGAFFINLGINYLTVIFSIAMGLFIGSSSRKLVIVEAITPALNVVFMLFGGFLLPLSAIPDWFIWLHWISYVTYVFAGLVLTEFKGRVFECDDSKPSCYRSGEDFLKAYDLQTFSVGANAAFLAALTGVFFVLGYLQLRRLTNPKLRLDI